MRNSLAVRVFDYGGDVVIGSSNGGNTVWSMKLKLVSMGDAASGFSTRVSMLGEPIELFVLVTQ